MPLLWAASAASAPMRLALATFAPSFSRSGIDLLTVDAEANVTPAASSTNWTRMFLLVKRTLIRGHSLVPTIFLRMRQWRSSASLCLVSVRISISHGLGSAVLALPTSSLNRLAFLADNLLVRVAHAFALVRFGRIEAADFRGDLPHHLFIRAFHGQFGVVHDGHLDLVRYLIKDRVRETEIQVDILSLHRRLKADALNLQLSGESFT